ncbi:MAG: pyrroloquinoline quinone biosynthesis peptide chaperone PqqD [Candidatus Competibacterales bacterium]|nr:pyrroloquinoline quinone biosynthesis peptide chaperone PqqD [Candidatus Competibacterales bacterium]
MSALPAGPLRIAPGLRLQWEEAQQCHVLLYPEGMVQLNASSAEILGRCDGSRDAQTLIEELQQEYPDADLADDVREFLAAALANGWLVAA